MKEVLFFFLIFIQISFAQRILEVGPGKAYSNPQSAILQAIAGDTVLMYPAVYKGDYYIQNLKGKPNARITIKGTNASTVIIEGATSFQFSEIEYVNLMDFTVRRQSNNGLNIDDGGTYITPAKFVLIQNISFMDMNATGNNDQLKLSGLDSFEVIDCKFLNGSAGGSGIDMVGCHQGTIRNSSFTNQGSNSIQAKGGCKDLRIERNHFVNGGDRTLNLGGSTGEPYFRPLGINYEAKDLLVSSNFFEASQAPIAFVGARYVQVSNNTFYNPSKWLFRILQESSDTNFYLSCANNTFSNNIIYVSTIHPTINIGPYTSEKTFLINNNLWYSNITANWNGPSLPVVEKNGIYGKDPLMENITTGNIKLQSNSPALANGLKYSNINLDYYGNSFKSIPAIGAAEYVLNTSNYSFEKKDFNIYPNPTKGILNIDGLKMNSALSIFNLNGEFVSKPELKNNSTIDISGLSNGFYFLRISDHQNSMLFKIIKIQ